MKKKIFVWIVMVITSVTILVGVAIMAHFLNVSNSDDSIELSITANGEKRIEFDDLFLIPGEQREYTVILRSNIRGQYTVKLDGIEEGDKTLKHYAYVMIETGDEILCDKPLIDFFEDEPIELDCYLSEDSTCEVKFKYYMPIEIGNEAENASADFDIVISAK